MPTKHAHHPILATFAATLAGAAITRAEEPPELPPVPVPNAQEIYDEVFDPNLGAPELPPEQATPSALPEPSANMAVNLVVLMVRKGLITQEEGLALIEQAEAEARAAQAATVLPPPPKTE